MLRQEPIDPVCLVHGKRKSEHDCLCCCLCFKPLTRDECSYLPNGQRQDTCVPCAEAELETMAALARRHQRIEPFVKHIAGMIDPGDNYGMIPGQMIRDARKALADA